MEIEQELEAPRVTLNAPMYNAKHVRLGTFLGGPLVAGYFIAENYKVFGDYGKAKAAWIYTIAFIIVMFGLVLFMPQSVQIPNYVFPIAYCWIAFYLTQHFQGDQINAYAASGQAFFGWGRVVLIGFIGLAVTVILLIMAIMALGDLIP